MKQVHLIITGFVQGIGFRQFIKRKARKLGLKGWIRNRTDGSVEAVVVGEKKDLGTIIAICKKGPPLAKVSNVVVKWEENPNQQFESFDVVPTI